MALIKVDEKEFKAFIKDKELTWAEGEYIPFEIFNYATLDGSVVAATQQLAFACDSHFIEESHCKQNKTSEVA